MVPVLTSSGHTYEWSWIIKSFLANSKNEVPQIDPITRIPCSIIQLLPNNALISLLELKYKQTNDEERYERISSLKQERNTIQKFYAFREKIAKIPSHLTALSREELLVRKQSVRERIRVDWQLYGRLSLQKLKNALRANSLTRIIISNLLGLCFFSLVGRVITIYLEPYVYTTKHLHFIVLGLIILATIALTNLHSQWYLRKNNSLAKEMDVLDGRLSKSFAEQKYIKKLLVYPEQQLAINSADKMLACLEQQIEKLNEFVRPQTQPTTSGWAKTARFFADSRQAETSFLGSANDHVAEKSAVLKFQS
jgi:hypothetical protein